MYDAIHGDASLFKLVNSKKGTSSNCPLFSVFIFRLTCLVQLIKVLPYLIQ